MNTIERMINHSQLDWTVVRIVNPNVKTNGNGYSVTFGDTKGMMNISRFNLATCRSGNHFIKQQCWQFYIVLI